MGGRRKPEFGQGKKPAGKAHPGHRDVGQAPSLRAHVWAPPRWGHAEHTGRNAVAAAAAAAGKQAGGQAGRGAPQQKAGGGAGGQRRQGPTLAAAM